MKIHHKKTSSNIAAPRVLISSSTTSLLVPARITIEESLITSVEVCSPEEYPERVKTWRKEDPNLEIFAEDSLLTPAFINAHTHLAMSFFRGIDLAAHNQNNLVEDLFFTLEQHLSPEEVRAFARMGAYESLLSGTGLVWDHYYCGASIAEALADTGLAGVVAPTLQDLSGPGKATWEQQWQDTEAINNSARLRSKGIFASFGPHATETVSSTLWKNISAAAARLQLPLHAHLAQSLEEWQHSQAHHGCSPTVYLQRLGVLQENSCGVFAHGIFADQHDLSVLARARQHLVFCPFSAMIFAFPANLMAWQAAGVSWAVATDCVASNDSMNVQKELRYISGYPLAQISGSRAYQEFLEGKAGARVVAGVRQQQWAQSTNFRNATWLLSKVWEVPGSMHPQVRVGRIQPGALANIVAWNTNNAALWPGNQLRTIAFGDTASSIEALMVAGRWIGKRGNFAASLLQSSAYRESEDEARRRLGDLLRRCGI